jgi:hypothetical protein
VIALFVASAVVGALSSVAADRAPTGNTGSATLADTFCSFSQTNCPSSQQVPTVPAAVLAGLRATPGVWGVTVVHQSESEGSFGNTSGVVTCQQLASTPAIGSCAHGVTVANIGYFLSRVLGHTSRASTTRWPSAQLSVAKATSLPIAGVVVATDGSSSSLERVRTLLEGDFPYQGTPVTVLSLDPSTARTLAMVDDMTDVIIVASLIIAACSLAVSISAGLGERKRPFSLLRLTGAPLSTLRRVVALESALPLLTVAVISIAVGLAAAALYIHSQVGLDFKFPGLTYWGTVVGGLAASLAIIASTFPLLSRMTGPEVARND